MLRLLQTLGVRRSLGRSILPVLGIALGVALGYGVHLVNRAAVSDVAAAVRALAGEADLVVRGGRSGFAEDLYPKVAAVKGVAMARPALELEAGVADVERSIRVIGVDVLRDPLLLRHPDERIELLKPDRVVLSTEASAALGGKKLRLVVGQQVRELEVAGALPMKGFVALTDIATAQWRLGRVGELNRLDVRVAEGADRVAVQQRIAAVLPPGVFVSAVEALEEASGYPSRAYRVNLNVLAMVALFTGGFLVFSAQALEMTRRRGEHALLRVLGLRGAGVLRLVLIEAGMLGAAGALAGLALGYALAWTAVRLVGADLGAGAFRGVFPELRVEPLAAAGYFVAGIAIAIAGAFLPALDAARRPPARALKAGDEQVMFERATPAWPALVLLGAAAALAQLGPIAGLPVFGYAAIFCLLLGSVMLVPRLAQLVFARISSPSKIPILLALAQLRGAPGQAAVSLAAIVASFSLMTAMAIMVASFRGSVDDWLTAVLPADLYVRTTHAGDTGLLEPGFEARVAALPQVRRADFLRTTRVALDPARPPLVLIARDRAERAFPILDGGHRWQPGDPPRLWVSEAVADLHRFEAGKVVTLPLAGKERAFMVAGVFRDYARQHGALLVEREDYVALTGDPRVNDGALWLAPGVSSAQAMDALRALPGGPQLDIADPGEIKRLSLRIFDRSFAVTYAMEAVAVLVGLFGLSSSLGAIVLARRREFGVLRHLGVTRGQIRAMLAAEGGLLALVGAAAGLAAGIAISLVLVFVVNRQSFNWGMEMHWPYGLLALFIGLLVGLAILTAVFSGREATGVGPVRAVREDW
jgi:putative ABC transport system permease protein